MILITGATGTNGLELIHQLADAGEHVRVRALVRSPERAQQMFDPNEVDLSAGDLDDPAALDEVEEALQTVGYAGAPVPSSVA